ncbi:hypothetical protein AKO1_014235, partial [Acrasis kona]
MDYEEEQRTEKEALESIYADSYQEVEKNLIKINIYPYTVESDDEINYVGLTLQITYPETYPEVKPEISIFSLKGLAKKETDELKKNLEQIAEDNLGTIMVFTLASSAQEWLLEHNDQKTAKRNEEIKQETGAYESEEEEEDEYEKLMREKSQVSNNLTRYSENTQISAQTYVSQGTPVTKEIFNQWKEQFILERKEVREKLQQESNTEGQILYGKLTGREIFEQKKYVEKVGADGVDIDE